MYGLINKAIEVFAIETQGRGFWQWTLADMGIQDTGLGGLLHHDTDLTRQLLAGMERKMARPQAQILEDLGTFLITSPAVPAIRRLLRFSGDTYADFLLSLDELPGRARLAVDDLHLPELTVTDLGGKRFELACAPGLTGFDHVLLGMLRAMADEFGALAMLDHLGARGTDRIIGIEIVEDAYSAGRAFALGMHSA
jgi:hypothetical protein